MLSAETKALAKEENTPEQQIADRILFILENFPIISPSMLQISLGSGVPTSFWQPVLDKLIQSGQAHRSAKCVVSPKGRKTEQTYISLKPLVHD